MRVLIVDSSMPVMERLEEMISEAENVEVVDRALSYRDAKKLLKENRYEDVLLEIDLPENTSIQLLKEIKSEGRESRIIILFTYMDKNTLEQCKLLGVDYFIDKFYEFEKIYELF